MKPPGDEEITPALVKKSNESRKLISSIWNYKEFHDLFKVSLGSLVQYDLHFKRLIDALVSTTAPFLHKIKTEWDFTEIN